MQGTNTTDPQLDAYGVVGSQKRLKKKDLKLCWDLILSAFKSEGGREGLAIVYGKSAGFIEALYYADVIDQDNADALKQVRSEAYSLADERITAGEK